MNKLFTYSAIFPIVFISFVSIFFIPAIVNFYKDQSDNIVFTFFSSSSNKIQTQLNDSADFMWPVPGYTNITSKFGYRKAPANGASTFHGGIDIGVPERNKYILTCRWKSDIHWLEWSKWVYSNN